MSWYNLALAERLIRSVTEKCPKWFLGWQYLGDVLLLRNQILKASESHRKADALNPNFQPVIMNAKLSSQTANLESEPQFSDEVVLSRTALLVAMTANLAEEVGLSLATYVAMTKDFIRIETKKLAQDLRETPHAKEKWIEKGFAHELLDEYKKASESYAYALDHDPADVAAQSGLFRALKLWDTKDRIKSYSKHQVVQNSIAAYGRTFSRAPELLKKPIEIVHGALQLQLVMKCGEALASLGLAHLESGNCSQAHDLIRKALAVDPDVKLEPHGLAILSAQRKWVESCGKSQLAVSSKSTDLDEHISLACGLARNGNLVGSMSIFHHLRMHHASNAEVWAGLEDVYLLTNQNQKAKEAHQAVVALSSDT